MSSSSAGAGGWRLFYFANLVPHILLAIAVGFNLRYYPAIEFVKHAKVIQPALDPEAFAQKAQRLAVIFRDDGVGVVARVAVDVLDRLVDAVDEERDHLRGPGDALVTVVEYGDFQCPHCAQFQPMLSAWQRRLPADVRFTYVPAQFGGTWDHMSPPGLGASVVYYGGSPADSLLPRVKVPSTYSRTRKNAPSEV